jgi:hypothetical protein
VERSADSEGVGRPIGRRSIRRRFGRSKLLERTAEQEDLVLGHLLNPAWPRPSPAEHHPGLSLVPETRKAPARAAGACPGCPPRQASARARPCAVPSHSVAAARWGGGHCRGSTCQWPLPLSASPSHRHSGTAGGAAGRTPRRVCRQAGASVPLCPGPQLTVRRHQWALTEWALTVRRCQWAQGARKVRLGLSNHDQARPAHRPSPGAFKFKNSPRAASS